MNDDDKLRKVGPLHAPGYGWIGCEEGGYLGHDEVGNRVLHRGTLVRYSSIGDMHATHRRRLRKAAHNDELKPIRKAA